MNTFSEKILFTPPSQTLRALIDKHAVEQAERTFILFPESGIELSYHQLQQNMKAYGCYFRALGLIKGDTISFMMGNGPTSLELFLASLYSGNISAPLNPAAGPEQIEYVLDHSDTKIVFVSEAYQAQVLLAVSKIVRDIKIIICDVDTGPQWPVAAVTDLPPVTLEAGNDALLMYTSGTTGRPKGVVLTHNNLLAGGMNTACAHELSADDRALCVLPLCHINAQCSTVMGPLVTAGSVVMPHGFSVSSFWRWVIDYHVSWFSVVPTIISYLIYQATESSATIDLKKALSNVRFGRSASAPLAPSLHELFEEKFGMPIVETMGLTETSAQLLSNPMPPKKGKYGSPGIGFGTEINIINKKY